MLFKTIHLQGIRAGLIDLAFRQWKRPSVNTGSLVKTAVGQIEICALSVVGIDDISPSEAQRAGFESLETLLSMLKMSGEGNVYRIELKYHSADPRISLRNQSELTTDELETIHQRLERLDKYSKVGKWVHETLEVISDHPKLRAQDLADMLHREKAWLKPNIRKLKNLGLTISHEVGYEISPLGQVYLQWSRGRS